MGSASRTRRTAAALATAGALALAGLAVPSTSAQAASNPTVCSDGPEVNEVKTRVCMELDDTSQMAHAYSLVYNNSNWRSIASTVIIQDENGRPLPAPTSAGVCGTMPLGFGAGLHQVCHVKARIVPRQMRACATVTADRKSVFFCTCEQPTWDTNSS
jgi:hypothetical protein